MSSEGDQQGSILLYVLFMDNIDLESSNCNFQGSRYKIGLQSGPRAGVLSRFLSYGLENWFFVVLSSSRS